ncbi:MAG: Sapep family Mn(2+)-dependent dipeptidase [Oscillospiraceae bacterium]|nr:Sapep family Mn(2+)-dependent dipeptidase [Oscillospiraceae bacterium]
MINEISKKAHEYTDSAVKLLSELISYKSVMGETEENMPYGRACAECLEFAAKTLYQDGFRVRNFENHAITADFGDGKAELGILCHLDVVPTDGQEWSSDPFKADIRESRVYGRGAIDDKGPAAAVITAMRMIRDSGIKLRKNFRLILGSNEENGSGDMEYYTKKEKFPPMLFTPDGSFPVINIEKGMIRLGIKGDYSSGEIRLISLKGGSVANAVPERAEAVVSGISQEDIINASGEYKPNGIIFSVIRHDDYTVSIKAKGKGAHASTPTQGKNALTALITLLSKLPFDGDISEKLTAMSKLYPHGDSEGDGMGAACEDMLSGKLTLVLSLADCSEGKLSFMTDCRFPTVLRSGNIIPDMQEKLSAAGLAGEAVLVSEPHHADENSEMIRTLLSVYEDCTGKKGECIAIGGGTYVHDTENGVAFGAEWSDENNMHGADEFIGIDELTKDIEIYCEAILRLCM